jgi:hypothetical protein
MMPQHPVTPAAAEGLSWVCQGCVMLHFWESLLLCSSGAAAVLCGLQVFCCVWVRTVYITSLNCIIFPASCWLKLPGPDPNMAQLFKDDEGAPCRVVVTSMVNSS